MWYTLNNKKHTSLKKISTTIKHEYLCWYLIEKKNKKA